MIGGQFDDGKEDDALRTIGELCRALGLKPHVLRYWEEQFPMLQPLKRSGGRRYYRAEDIALVQTIDRLVNEEGYTLKGARSAIEQGRAEMDRNGIQRAGDKPAEAPREGMRRYLTASDLPDRDEPPAPPAGPPLRRASDASRDKVLRELKSIRDALADAIAD
ncbi:MerR family transcriptional regulator [Citromicrobium bathyomarinum]|uniref:MerR family transcriptional regulator n=1 Tax=Citromicrobium bathyomarinum TaxID=72174 RepID=UPI00315B274C